MPPIEFQIREWLGERKTFKGVGETGLVREIINAFQASRAENVEQMETLEVLARITGYDSVLEMLGASVCDSDGSRTLTLTPRA